MSEQKKQKRREETEETILDAFETVLMRDGAHKVTLMSVANEAGVTKVLIYRYFDDLVGLIKTWASRRQKLPDFKSLFDDGDISEFNDNPLQYQKVGLRRLAEYLRGSPISLELLIAELLETGPVSEALQELRVEQTQKDGSAIGRDATNEDFLI